MLQNKAVLLVGGIAFCIGMMVQSGANKTKEEKQEKTIREQKKTINILERELKTKINEVQKQIDGYRLDLESIQFKSVEEMQHYIEKLNRNLELEKLLEQVFES